MKKSHFSLAVAPFTPDSSGVLKDADGDRVITCDEEGAPCAFYKEKIVEADPWFICPTCGRLGQRMIEAMQYQLDTL